MPSSYTHTTALKIYTTIAASGDRGVDLEQLQAATGFAANTLCTYGRWLEDEGAIVVHGIHSEARNRPLKNLYVAVKEPQKRLTDREKLNQVVGLLLPFEKHPESWDKGFKGEIIYAIQEALKIASSK